MTLDKETALVTGGAKRVGRAIVLELARAGCNVAIHYRQSEAEANELAEIVSNTGRRAVALSGDLNDPASWPAIVQRTVDELGALTILVNNASEFTTDAPESAEDFDSDHWERILRVNLVAPMGLCHHARPHLASRGRGAIVNLCDISSERPWPDHLAYCVSKAGLASLTRGLARTLAPDIRVNGIAPGIAAFPAEYSSALREHLTSQVPLGRPGTPEEVARLVRFVIESGDYITGQVIGIDGGRSVV